MENPVLKNEFQEEWISFEGERFRLLFYPDENLLKIDGPVPDSLGNAGRLGIIDGEDGETLDELRERAFQKIAHWKKEKRRAEGHAA